MYSQKSLALHRLKQGTLLAHNQFWFGEGIGGKLTTTMQVTGNRLGSEHKLYHNVNGLLHLFVLSHTCERKSTVADEQVFAVDASVIGLMATRPSLSRSTKCDRYLKCRLVASFQRSIALLRTPVKPEVMSTQAVQ